MENNNPSTTKPTGFFLEYLKEQERLWQEEMRRMEEKQRRREEEEARRQQEEARRQQEEAQRHRLLMLQEHSRELFFQEPEDICFDPDGSISSARLYAIYRHWCREKGIVEQTERTFSLFVKKNAASYRLVYSMNIPTPDGKHIRGYRGIREKQEGEIPHTSHTSCG